MSMTPGNKEVVLLLPGKQDSLHAHWLGEICWGGYKERVLLWKVSVDRQTERTPTLTSETTTF